MPYTVNLQPLFQNVARRMQDRHFHALAEALRARIGSILIRWREQSLVAMPGLDQFTVVEFEDSMAVLLRTVAAALETDDPEQLRRVIEEAPLHGADRIAQRFPLDALLAEAGILRGSIVLELREEMGAGLREEEAAALHELIDLAVEHSALEFIAVRTRQRESELDLQIAGIRRLADVGTLVAGVAHDAANLLLPMRMGLDRLKRCCTDEEALSNIETLEHVFRYFQNTIVNLRWLTVDASHQRRDAPPLDLRAFANDYKKFFASMLPRGVALELDIPEQVPQVRITAAALSQILFNLTRNAQEAIIRHQQRGRIVFRAEPAGGGEGEGWVTLAVEDDGPGMPPEVAAHCFEPFFTTKPGDGAKSGGLGLSVVHALVGDSGGSIEVRSPARPAGGGTAFVLRLPAAIAPATPAGA